MYGPLHAVPFALQDKTNDFKRNCRFISRLPFEKLTGTQQLKKGPILTLSSHLLPRLPSCLFPSDTQSKIAYVRLIPGRQCTTTVIISV